MAADRPFQDPPVGSCCWHPSSAVDCLAATIRWRVEHGICCSVHHPAKTSILVQVTRHHVWVVSFVSCSQRRMWTTYPWLWVHHLPVSCKRRPSRWDRWRPRWPWWLWTCLSSSCDSELKQPVPIHEERTEYKQTNGIVTVEWITSNKPNAHFRSCILAIIGKKTKKKRIFRKCRKTQ